MDVKTAKRLQRMTRDFYASNHESFSNSRNASWAGWNRACAAIPAGSGRLRALDVACGNMRFLRHLENAFPGKRIEYTGIDSCPELVCAQDMPRFKECDIIEMLRAEEPIVHEEYDIVVSFGFFHHVPGSANRARLLQNMADALADGGVAIASFWKFAQDAKLRSKAERVTRDALSKHALDLESGDYLLGWDGRTDALRYCHSFVEEEIDSMFKSLSTSVAIIDSYEADGRTGKMNAYRVFRRT